MTTQEAIEILTEMRDWNDYITQSDALQMAIDALEKEPAANSEDAISRQAVMDGMEKYHDGADLHIDGLTYAYDLVCKLPSVSVAEKTGRWEWNQYDYNPNLGNWHCSECGSIAIECVPKKDPSGVPLYKYCPQCGCRLMEVK